MVVPVTSAVVLLALAVSVLGWENLPAIPAGRRAEYYLLHDDGAYKFGYDTGEGQSAAASADQSNQVQGQYSYVDNAGQRVSLAYTAGDAGFVPQLEGTGTSASRVGISGVSGTGTGNSIAGFKASVQNGGFATDGNQNDEDYDANSDASYAFSIDTDTYKRTEAADAKGNVRGHYAYSSQAGGSHALSYIAGEGTGFVVTGSEDSVGTGSQGSGAVGNTYIPPSASAYSGGSAASAYSGGSAANTRRNLNDDGSYSFSFNTNDQSREEAADSQNNVRGSYSFKAKDDGKLRRVDYSAGPATGFLASGAHLPVPPSASGGSTPLGYPSFGQSGTSYSSASTAASQGGAGSDGSYTFSYDAGDSSRQESADSQNNVRGSFSFRGKDDGETRRVDYEAGASTGFVAKGAHLPVAPSPLATSPGGYGSQAPIVSSYSGGSSGQEATSGDASYTFSYNTGDQSRQESSDAQGNVNGQFSFVATDGVQRKVDYTAGAEKGFIAKGAHLPVAPETNVAAVSSLGYSRGAASSFGQLSQPTVSSYSGDSSYSSGGAQSDGSYSFSYNAGDHSRQESSDALNNVRGSYSFRAKDDGQTRKVDYEAGAATGFVAKGGHLPVAPSPSAAISGYSFSSQSSATPYSAGSAASASSAGPQSDGSYSFSYNTADQSRQESGDAQNNVRGSYSFKAKDDGQTRSVNYVAGASTGFIASGTHLPVAPSGTSSASPYSQSFSSNAYSGSVNTAATKSTGPSADGSYSFSYNAGDHSREESSDAQGNVRGRYSFTAKDDGQTKQVDYEAGADKGFIAKGAHLPSTYPASPSSVGYQGTLAYQGVAVDSSQGDQSNGDASYSYNYQTDSSSKQESSDAQGNVQGSFSFLGGDGVSRNVQYTSRGNDGFVVTGDHLPIAGSEVSGAGPTGFGTSNFASRTSAGSYSAKSSHAKSLDLDTDKFRIQKYLPPENSRKFGYIFDTKV